MDGIDEINKYTCVTLLPRDGQEDYINIKSDDDGCWSWVGRIGGGQQLNLDPSSCMTVSYHNSTSNCC